MDSDPSSLTTVILALCEDAGPGRTIAPAEAAQAYAEKRGEGELGWRAHLPGVRRVAVADRLASRPRFSPGRNGMAYQRAGLEPLRSLRLAKDMTSASGLELGKRIVWTRRAPAKRRT